MTCAFFFFFNKKRDVLPSPSSSPSSHVTSIFLILSASISSFSNFTLPERRRRGGGAGEELDRSRGDVVPVLRRHARLLALCPQHCFPYPDLLPGAAPRRPRRAFPHEGHPQVQAPAQGPPPSLHRPLVLQGRCSHFHLRRRPPPALLLPHHQGTYLKTSPPGDMIFLRSSPPS